MNVNYIAPEVLDDNVKPTCCHCGRTVVYPEQKMTFYQGQCPNCGHNPSVLTKKEANFLGHAQPLINN